MVKHEGDIGVFIVEEDPFACNWISLLIARDWRTQLLGDSLTLADSTMHFNKNSAPFAFLLLDADFVTSENLPNIQTFLKKNNDPSVFVIGDHPKTEVLKLVIDQNYAGYVVKSEIHFSLAWALDFAFQENFVISPGIYLLGLQERFSFPENKLIVEGSSFKNNLSEEDLKLARLALIFSMERKELSQELNITVNWGYGKITDLYKKLGVEDLFDEKINQEDYLGNHPIMVERLKEIVNQSKSPKKRNLEPLAFHLLTMPDVRFE